MNRSFENRIAAVMLLIAMALSLTACRGVMLTPEELTSKYTGDLSEEQMKEEGLYGARFVDLLENWGSASFYSSCNWVFAAGDRYLQVTLDGPAPSL